MTVTYYVIIYTMRLQKVTVGAKVYESLHAVDIELFF